MGGDFMNVFCDLHGFTARVGQKLSPVAEVGPTNTRFSKLPPFLLQSNLNVAIMIYYSPSRLAPQLFFFFSFASHFPDFLSPRTLTFSLAPHAPNDTLDEF